jgi:hypothetical protein
MERHFAQECSVMTGKAKSKAPRCATGKCNKVLYAPIKCDVRILFDIAFQYALITIQSEMQAGVLPNAPISGDAQLLVHHELII